MASIVKEAVRNERGVKISPAVLRCDCGNYVALDSGWANACDHCPAEYNGGGQRLAPRRFWGEETGETFK